jgi:hypothetical protein
MIFAPLLSEQLRQRHLFVNSCTLCTLGLPSKHCFLVLHLNIGAKRYNKPTFSSNNKTKLKYFQKYPTFV